MSRLTHGCHCGASYRSRWRYRVHRLFCGAPYPREHWLPVPNSVEAWEVGLERCFWCLTHVRDPEFGKPCTRRRPSGVELYG